MLTKPSPCSGKYILPGGIDMNVHLQRPAYGTQTIDDFYQVFSINSINA
jgi:dihydroorotase-like cyclic amidohydrolase